MITVKDLMDTAMITEQFAIIYDINECVNIWHGYIDDIPCYFHDLEVGSWDVEQALVDGKKWKEAFAINVEVDYNKFLD